MPRLRRLAAGALIPALVFVAASAATVVGSPQGKTAVCHRTGNGGYHEIVISNNAVPAHMAHGDVVPDEYGTCP